MPGDHGSTTFEVEELLTDPEQLRFKSQTIFVSCGSWIFVFGGGMACTGVCPTFAWDDRGMPSFLMFLGTCCICI